jgi:ubiquinone/menaquinone biosynthesis C-methylase UbiE
VNGQDPPSASTAARDLDTDMAAFLGEWMRSIAAKDSEAAAALRTADYCYQIPGGQTRTLADDLGAIASPDYAVEPRVTRIDAVTGGGSNARVCFEMGLRDRRATDGVDTLFRCDMALVREGAGWKARSMAISSPFDAAAATGRPDRSAKTLLRRIADRLRRTAKQWRPSGAGSFQTLAYMPYLPGKDYSLPRSAPPTGVGDEAPLPVPPPELWLGYYYPAHGSLHVRTMLDIVEAGGFGFADGDRVLDLGCGAGRMIRHLAPLAERCEIWGADISAEHIYWCQRNLSPPFHFLVNTKVPHLPFADGSFQFVYCGSLFTHIDDMARAWLLELRRILGEQGCAYVTIHDEHTVRLFDQYEAPPAIVRQMRTSPTFVAAKAGSDMFTIGRDEQSQVFYTIEWFTRLLAPMFEIVSVTPEAYFYQTAILIRPRAG